METAVPLRRAFSGRLLPWLLAGLFLGLYLITHHPWISLPSAPVFGQVAGLDGAWPYQRPAFALVVWVFRFLPLSVLPLALNCLAAVLGAAVLAILARCALILPRDRTREERLRLSPNDPQPLGRWTWAPPLMAVALIGLQRTFWEHATAQTGELWDLLLFGSCILCLGEYRIDRQDRWLMRFAFVYGVGMVDNWALYGFAPLFFIALLWIRGSSLFHPKFLLRFIGFGACGLSLYLIAPLVGFLQTGTWISWGESLYNHLIYQKTTLLGVPRGRILLLALINLLPLVMLGIRWDPSKRPRIERWASVGTVVVLQIAGLAASIVMALDLKFGPRQLIYLDPAAGGTTVPLLTFHFCSALLAAYFSGYFILIGGFDPARKWEQLPPLLTRLTRLGWAISVALPVVSLVFFTGKNWQAIRTENQPYLRQLVLGFREKLPSEGALILCEDPLLRQLLLAVDRSSRSPHPNLFIQTEAMPESSYRRRLARQVGAADWPEFQTLAEARTNIAGIFLSVWHRAVRENKAYLVTPQMDFLTEGIRLEPVGLAFRAVPAPEDGLSGVFVSPTNAPSIVSDWDQRWSQFKEFTQDATGNSITARATAQFLSKSANIEGVGLQQRQLPVPARHLFEIAEKFDPGNVSAAVNLLANTELQAGRSVGEKVRQPLEGQNPVAVFFNYGPIEEPDALINLGREMMRSVPACMQAATALFSRARELDPQYSRASLAYISALVNTHQPQKAYAELKTLLNRPGLGQSDRISALRFQTDVLEQLGRADELEKLLVDAVRQMPRETVPLDLLSHYYLEHRKLAPLAPVLDAWHTLQPGDSTVQLRRALLLMLQDKPKEAVAILDTLLAQDSDLDGARANRALALLQLKQFDKARGDFEEMLVKDPYNYIYHSGLAQICEQKQDKAGALSHWESFLASAPRETADYTNAVEKVRVLKKKG